MEEYSDRELILKVKNGEIDYFAYIVRRYSGLIYQKIKLKIKDKNETEDLVQNTFIKFYKAIENFDESKSILPYLFKIADNELKMFFRSRKPMVSLEDWHHLKTDQLMDSGDDYEKYLAKLKKEEKAMLLMIADGYSYQEVAKKFRRPLNTVKSIIRRARKKLIINR